MSKEEFFQEKVHAKLYALSLIYGKEENSREEYLARISYTPEELEAVLEGASDDAEFRDWIQSVIPVMQRREDTIDDIQDLIAALKKNTEEFNERDKKFYAAVKRHFKERHVDATSQIPRLAEKVRQTDGFWNKIKVVFIGIFQNIKGSIAIVKRQNKELREILRSK